MSTVSRGPRRALIALVVLATLLVAADRISLVVAEGAAANSIKSSQHLESTPSVSVSGFPFLTQLISGHYDDVVVRATGLPVGADGRRLRVSSVTVTLHDVHVSHGFDVVRAGTASAIATVSYPDLSAALNTTVTYAGSGRVAASAGATALGVEVRGTVSALPELTTDDQLRFADIQVSALGAALPGALNSLLGDVFKPQFPLATLPFGLRFVTLTATKAGVVVTLYGNNTVYDSRKH